MNLILFGFKSCGKTTLGKRIALYMNRPFFDTDQMLEKLYHQRTENPLSFRQIYQKIGDKQFRALESDVVEQLKEVQNAIIALGGGVILNAQNLAILEKLGALVYLRVHKDTLKKRILCDETPSFLNSVDPEGAFETFYEERKGPYEAIPALVVDMDAQDIDHVALEVSTFILNFEKSHGE